MNHNTQKILIVSCYVQTMAEGAKLKIAYHSIITVSFIVISANINGWVCPDLIIIE